jgi:chromosome segregation ATPase
MSTNNNDDLTLAKEALVRLNSGAIWLHDKVKSLEVELAEANRKGIQALSERMAATEKIQQLEAELNGRNVTVTVLADEKRVLESELRQARAKIAMLVFG